MISFYKWKRQAIFLMLGIIPLLLFLMFFFFSIKYYDLEGIHLMIFDAGTVAIPLVVAIVTIIVIIIIGNRWLRHALTSMLEGKGLLTFIVDSTGVIGSFNTRVNAPDMKGVFPQRNVPDINDTYDTDLLHRLMVPKDATMTKATSFDKDEKGNLRLGEQVDVLVLPKSSEIDVHKFSFENRPVLIFNKVMGKFLSRDSLAKFEKDVEIKHNALNILRKVESTDVSFRNFGRYVGEKIRPGKHGFFAERPIIKWIIYAAIIGLIVFIILLFVPGFLSAGSNLSFP